MTLKDRVKALAQERGISLPALESELGFGNSTIVKWDKSTPNADKLNAVAKYFNVTVEDLKGSRRSADIAFARQVAMYFCRDVANLSTPKIGLAFGKRDHSTVMHGCNKIANEIKENTNTKLIVETVKNSLFAD